MARTTPVLLVVAGLSAFGLRSDATPTRSTAGSPIQHVVIIFQENHSFDNVLGRFCVETQRCDGTTTGVLHDGTMIDLPHASDIVWHVRHTPKIMRTAIDRGKMDGFDLVNHCGPETGYGCHGQYDPADIPNLSALASAFALSDRTFQSSLSGSWTSHIEVVTSTLDGFNGSNPEHSKTGHDRGRGWGCDSFMDAVWRPPGGGKALFVPSCVPNQLGEGPYRASPVPWVPTIMDELEAAGLPWTLYGGRGAKNQAYRDGYFWEVCPTLAGCLLSDQAKDWKPISRLPKDAIDGRLPSLSLVTPTLSVSQHNDVSMAAGDNWIGDVVSAIERGPDWASTAIFITYDECGCFYDHVPPPRPAMGIRVPMVIVSPYARPQYSDSMVATFNSMLAFVEHTFGLPPLSNRDAKAYDYSGAFDFGQRPLPPVRMVHTRIPAWESRYLATHPADDNDPT